MWWVTWRQAPSHRRVVTVRVDCASKTVAHMAVLTYLDATMPWLRADMAGMTSTYERGDGPRAARSAEIARRYGLRRDLR